MAYDKRGRRRYRRRQVVQESAAGEIAIINAGGGGGGAANSIRPTGRAPSGQGGSYAARRAIADRLDTLDIQISKIKRTLAGSRGQSKFRRRDAKARARLQLLKKARSDAGKIARASGDWQFKRELINAVIGSASAQYQS